MQNAQQTSEPYDSSLGWPAPLTSPLLAGQLRQRPAQAADDDFLLALFAEARPELGLLPEPVREQLLRLQFEAQRRQYRADTPDAVDWILELHRGDEAEQAPVGRCYLRLGPDELRLLDLAVTERLRGNGVGSSVLEQLRTVAERAGVPLRLSVWQANDGAIRLYRRLGFVEDGDQDSAGGYLRMHWAAFEEEE
ncbi:MAG: GNAT family N-acetyltransferase [Jatrophihabitantaceae bacterium]